MRIPKGYLLAAQKDNFVWARNEYPTASQGFFVYSYPYKGPESLSAKALIAARNKFAALIPGSVGRLVHDHFGRFRARLPHVPPRGTPVV